MPAARDKAKGVPSAYARDRARRKVEERQQIQSKKKKRTRMLKSKEAAQENGRCGCMTKSGRRCLLYAGMGTDHPGFGPCKHHGGHLPSVRGKLIKDEAILMGAPKEINALDALIWCIKITAGEVEFCTVQMQLLEKDEWFESTIVGKQLHIWAKERQRAVDRLAKFAKDALALGIADRAVRLAEQYGASIARYTKGLLDDLELTPDQVKKAPLVVRKHLALLEGGSPVTDEERADPLAAIPKRNAS